MRDVADGANVDGRLARDDLRRQGGQLGDVQRREVLLGETLQGWGGVGAFWVSVR